MNEVLQALLAALLLLCFSVRRPTRYRCGDGFYVLGIRPSGETRCMLAPAGNGDDECVAGSPCHFEDNAFSYPVQLYCSGSQPIVVDERTVGCQRTRYTVTRLGSL